MAGRLLILGAAFGAGYVLGAKAGRGRYEQIRSRADRIWSDPHTQRAVSDTKEFVDDAAPVVKEKASKAAKAAGDTVEDAARTVGAKAQQTAAKAQAKADDATD